MVLHWGGFDSLLRILFFHFLIYFWDVKEIDLLLTWGIECSKETSGTSFCCINLAAFMMVCLSIRHHFAIVCSLSECFKQANRTLLAYFSLWAVSAVLLCNGYFPSVFGEQCMLLQMGMTFHTCAVAAGACHSFTEVRQPGMHPGVGREVLNPSVFWGH